MNIPEAAVVAATKVLLADNISNHAGDTAPQIIDACEKVARAALEAAAPHMQQVITTLAEVQALPDDTVVRTHGGVPLEKWEGDDATEWRVAGHRPWTDAELAHNLPATVLYRPTV